jgi:serine/threonine-protein kinase HipA
VPARPAAHRCEDHPAIVGELSPGRPPPDGADGPLRVHQEDLCQALSVDPSLKYESDGGPGPVRIIEFLREVMDARRARETVWRFVDALAWNWLIAGTDAHAKNYSLLLAGGQIRLAPLYDVASALPYPGVHERRLRPAMRVGRDYQVFPHHDPWPRAAAI